MRRCIARPYRLTIAKSLFRKTHKMSIRKMPSQIRAAVEDFREYIAGQVIADAIVYEESDGRFEEFDLDGVAVNMRINKN